MMERMLHWYHQTVGMRYAALRYFNACGAMLDADGMPIRGEDHHPETHLIPLTLQVPLGQRDAILIYGTDYNTPDGTCIRDYVHIEDLASAHVLALDALGAGEGRLVYNLGNGRGYSVREVIDIAREVTGVDFPAVETERRPVTPTGWSHRRAGFRRTWTGSRATPTCARSSRRRGRGTPRTRTATATRRQASESNTACTSRSTGGSGTNTTTGSGQYLRGLLTALVQRAPQHRYSLVVPPHARTLDHLPPDVDVLPVRMRLGGHLGKVWFEQRAFPRAVGRLGADVAHVPYWGPPLRSPAPVVCSVLDVIPLVIPAYRQGVRNRLYTSLVVAAAARGAARLLTISEDARRTSSGTFACRRSAWRSPTWRRIGPSITSRTASATGP